MTDTRYLRLGGACRCGFKKLLRYGGSSGPDVWDCCSAWKDRATGEIIGYGWDKRSDSATSPGQKLPRGKNSIPTAPATEPSLHLVQIDAAPAGMTTCVYERFDVDGVHLYVGISDAPTQRAKMHLKASTWFAFAVTGKEHWFSSRHEAEQFERQVIATARPIFNRQHAHAEAYADLVRYLVGKKRFDLLKVTATWG